MGQVLVGLEKLPAPQAANWVESLHRSAGVFQKKFGGYRVLLIAAGEKPTGGYDVKVEQVSLQEGKKWVVQVVFTEPKPGQMVTQAITYPYEVVAIPDDGHPIEVHKVEGKILEKLRIQEAE
ncbi:hypothetical protein KKC1_25080 [Calderihabitans maritimus]|uniref:PrcB C-terminal domain-containing protein n=2 Tax=Calderihabitans maritimus TaxID=1246530 RepID=A0A1Z5HV32_9FIRM|nr:hypothetical protein KKC1_25080 [Calderihabitans maritimus]